MPIGGKTSVRRAEFSHSIDSQKIEIMNVAIKWNHVVLRRIYEHLAPRSKDRLHMRLASALLNDSMSFTVELKLALMERINHIDDYRALALMFKKCPDVSNLDGLAACIGGCERARLNLIGVLFEVNQELYLGIKCTPYEPFLVMLRQCLSPVERFLGIATNRNYHRRDAVLRWLMDEHEIFQSQFARESVNRFYPAEPAGVVEGWTQEARA